jgi:hypothetical protein
MDHPHEKVEQGTSVVPETHEQCSLSHSATARASCSTCCAAESRGSNDRHDRCDVRPGDPTAFIVVAVALIGAALVWYLLPALRAASADPTTALRQE